MPLIKRIVLDRHFKLGDLAIALPEGCRHLVLTGPNGSGKTLALNAIAAEMLDGFRRTSADVFLDARAAPRTFASSSDAIRGSIDRSATQPEADHHQVVLDAPGARLFTASSGIPQPGLALFIEATRRFVAPRTNRPPDAIDPNADLSPESDAFYEWLRHQYLQSLLVRASGDVEAANRQQQWLQKFECKLREALGLPSLNVRFIPKTYELQFEEDEGGPYYLESLALGHASVLAILADILSRLDPDTWLQAPSQLGGIVLIDEPEMHLHPELQEGIMPFLTEAFPGIQFIVATHSPAVAANTPQAFVYDLKQGEGIPSADLRGIDYGRLAVGHFGIETPFDLVTSQQLRDLKRLADNDERQSDEYLALLRGLRGLDHPVVLTELLHEASRA